MEWWMATAVVGGLACGAVVSRNSALSFLAMMAFMPLALHTLYNDFGRFWVLMVLAFVVELMALARCARGISRRAEEADATLPAPGTQIVSAIA